MSQAAERAVRKHRARSGACREEPGPGRGALWDTGMTTATQLGAAALGAHQTTAQTATDPPTATATAVVGVWGLRGIGFSNSSLDLCLS